MLIGVSCISKQLVLVINSCETVSCSLSASLVILVHSLHLALLMCETLLLLFEMCFINMFFSSIFHSGEFTVVIMDCGSGEVRRVWVEFVTDERLSEAIRVSKGSLDGAIIVLANNIIRASTESLCGDVLRLTTGEMSTIQRDDLFDSSAQECVSPEEEAVPDQDESIDLPQSSTVRDDPRVTHPDSTVGEPPLKIFRRDVPRTKIDKNYYGGFPCRECKDWFADELDAAKTQKEVDEIWRRVNRCCKHRQDTAKDDKGIWRSTRPSTPPDYWNMSFEVKNRLKKK